MARIGLMTHPKFRRLCLLLSEPAAHVRGYLECLWDVGYENLRDRIGDATDVKLACCYPGEEKPITDALARSGFLDVRDGQYCIHDLFDHAPEYVKKRLRRAGVFTPAADTDRRSADNGGQRLPGTGGGGEGGGGTGRDGTGGVVVGGGAADRGPPPPPTEKPSQENAADAIAFEREFADRWSAAYPGQAGETRRGSRRAFATLAAFFGGDLTAFAAAAGRYLADQETYLVNRAHPPGLMAKDPHRWAAGRNGATATGPPAAESQLSEKDRKILEQLRGG